MGIKAGFVGLPNVGKSSIFNAITKSSVPAENYPFCTIDPHVAIANVPDKRLDFLHATFNSQKVIPATVQLVDIAGLVKGAAQGEGLGNQFLSHIMEVDLILHVVRCFEDNKIPHVLNAINPLDDFETINSELMLKDLEMIEKREAKVKTTLEKSHSKNISSQEIKDLKDELVLITDAKKLLEQGNQEKLQSIIQLKKEKGITTIPLLSAKNYLILANLSEEDMSNQNYLQNSKYLSLIDKFGQEKVIPISAKIEQELAQLGDEEKLEMLDSLNIKDRSLDLLIQKAYKNLNFITFFTCGPKESHAWSVQKGTTIHKAAGQIHSDMEKGFICAEIYNYNDLVELKSEQAIKNAGKLRVEGKEYIVQDGDIVVIRFNV